jgi:DNA helicase-2/ATP-dependent DNA helicase PcrA
MVTPEEILAARLGMVVAPAGCGKTHLLVETILSSPAGRTLVLTHTRAGVAVIRSRLAEKSIRTARVATLDNWCGWIASRLPKMSGYVPTGTNSDYSAARAGTLAVLDSDAVRRALAATYDRVLVDEYQDCGNRQHQIVMKLAEAVPVVGFGDPLQRVFDFNEDRPPPWADVIGAFGTRCDLDCPWRWENVGERAFGDWILRQRPILMRGGQIDFRTGPPNVRWLELPSDPALHRPFNLDAVPRPVAGTSLFVLTDRANTPARRDFARQGIRLTVVESADMPELMTWAATLEKASGRNRIEKLLAFAHLVMTGVDVAGTIARLESIKRGTARNPASDEEQMLMTPADGSAPEDLAMALGMMKAKRNVHRPELLEAFCQAAQLAGRDTNRSLISAAAYVRDRRASEGRRVGPRAVGSTLLLKGLEADHTVIVDADVMKATDLYVAISRGCRSLTVVSRSPLLPVVRG